MMVHTASDSPSVTLARRFFEEQDRLRGGPAPEMCDPAYVAVLGGNPPITREGHEGFARAFYAAFPDMAHDIEAAFGSGDRVAVRFVLRGTHRGSFFGIPATGRPVTVAAHVLMQVANGKVVKLHGIFDEAGLLRQLGVLNG